MRRLFALLFVVAASPLAAQDTTQVPGGVRVGIGYQPGVRPKLAVVPGLGIDSIRAIVRRDLDYTDRFEMLDAGDPSQSAPGGSDGGGLNYGIYKLLGAQFAVELVEAPGGVRAKLHDVGRSKVLNDQMVTLPAPTDPTFRMGAHRLSDEITRWAASTPGAAASRLMFVSGGRVYQIDSDGAEIIPVSPAGVTALSPVWSPDAQRIAYTRLENGRGAVVLQTLGSGASQNVGGGGNSLNITPAFSPDGRMLAYAKSDESGTDIYSMNAAENCCVQRLTVGRYADNLSPTFSPDGRRIAFVSTRAGPPQIYVMAADGTDQELLAPFDYGATGSSNAPEWSPDGANVVFHREVSRSPQLFLMDAAGRGSPRQLTDAGRNEDPTWSPDGRHVAFISDRSGRRQIWIIDIESGRVRQLSTPNAARLPAWSRRFGR
jgi:TolB protein